jgi:hypothetical protein
MARRRRVGCLHRRDQHLSAARPKDVVEGPGELRVPVAEQDPRPSRSLVSQYRQQVAGLLGDPGAVGLAMTPARFQAAMSGQREQEASFST